MNKLEIEERIAALESDIDMRESEITDLREEVDELYWQLEDGDFE